jgi:hypothetical protein
MNLEDLKTYLEYAKKAPTILGRRVDPVGTELSILEDVVNEVAKLTLAERDVAIPGITRAWTAGIIQGATAYFREKIKKDIMPLPYAKDDNLIIEPLYRPKIFGLNNFTVTWSGLTPPAVVNLINYELKVDKELIMLTDIIGLGPNFPALIQVTVDGETLRPYAVRKDFKASNVRIYELPFPVVADLTLKVDAQVEDASGTFEFIPVGIHLVLGSAHPKSLPA